MYRTSRLITLCAALMGLAGSGAEVRAGAGNAAAENPSTAAPSLLEQIRHNGQIVVATRNAPTTYYVGSHGPRGFEYEMIRDFARHLGVAVRLEVRHSIREVLDAVRNGAADLAAAGLTRTPARQQAFLAGPDYFDVRQQVVCRRGGAVPDTIAELADVKLAVIADSSYVERLEFLSGDFPELAWRTVHGKSTEQLLGAVWRGEIDCAVADSNIVRINRRYYPELVVAFDLTEPQPLAWMMPPGATQLGLAVAGWLKEYAAIGGLAVLEERYYGHVEVFDYVDVRVYYRRVMQRLPRYKPLFRTAAERHDLPWTLLAAQSYQESHWNPEARSPTGVRGLMMLTRITARAVGVENRLDPKQSVFGGARYLSRMIARVPDRVVGPDRIWFALAAYNVGMGHMHDAQTLARRLGRNPYRWADLEDVLPLLSQKAYYKDLKYGYARGTEPVRYVARIRDFRDILERVEAGDAPVVSALGESFSLSPASGRGRMPRFAQRDDQDPAWFTLPASSRTPPPSHWISTAGWRASAVH